VSKKQKLIDRIQTIPKNFTWDEAVTLMKACGFELIKNDGSKRMFRHTKTGLKIRVHEPHPEPTLKTYAVEILIAGLKNVGEIE
jgi:predicted RNA binding protein YcfA (HicA-like mRNA interferase family)